MNTLNTRVIYYPHIFIMQNMGNELQRFDTTLISITSVDDLDILNKLRIRARYCNGTIYSTVMSEGNGKIANELLSETTDDIEKDTKFFELLKNQFGVLRI